MKTAQWISMAVLLLLGGCGGKGNPAITMDVEDSGSGIETVDGGQDVCTPSCEGKECGDDGCGEDCGTCAFQLEACSEESQCIPAQCQSTKDCPGALVCDKNAGQCVICVGDEDCPEGQTCGADFECHEEYLCQSDLDCKNYAMVCDKDAGKCVDCLGPEECPAEQYCLDSYCVDDACTAGEAHCDGLDIVTCNDKGSAEVVTETCTDTQYCQDGQCHEQICPPGSLYCEDNLLHTCDPIGKEVIDTVDCGDNDKVCNQGECVEQVCEPNTTWCHDDFTKGLCAEDGMSYIPENCPAEHHCDDSESVQCLPWVCPPGEAFCEDNSAKVCNGKGSAIINEIVCEDTICVEGQCVALACVPDSLFCLNSQTAAECSENGLTFEETPCPEESTCLNGLCIPWSCKPGEKMCNDQIATTCGEDGLGPEEDGTDCGVLGQACKQGACIECVPSCFAKLCGDDGCGGSCGTCDEEDDDPCTMAGCIEGAFSECGQVPIEGCCQFDADCDDQDDCTDEMCVNMQCVYADICCEEDSDCEDNNPCTNNICAATSCVSKPLGLEGCCPTAVFAETFEAGMENGWQFQTDSQHYNWELDQELAHSGQTSLHARVHHDGNGGLTSASFPPFLVSPQGATVSAWVKTANLPENPWACNTDFERIEIHINGFPTYSHCAELDDWQLVEVSLLPWAGQQVHVAFVGVGAGSSDFHYWVDDISVTANCP